MAYQAGTQLRTQHMRDSLKAGESMPEVHAHFGEPDIRTDAGKNTEIWSYATRANSNDLAATLFYTSAKEGDKGHFMDLKFVDGKLVAWKEEAHTMPSKRSTGINYGFTAGPGAQSVTHF
ncbi:MAG: hypothetical protein IVW54_00510 [Candidatus Binataceae bacterium]|nr:hypothetical protein [Candidatus Binataceae bacterium]